MYPIMSGQVLCTRLAGKLFIYIPMTFVILVNTFTDKANTQYNGNILAMFSKAFIYTVTKEEVLERDTPHILTNM